MSRALTDRLLNLFSLSNLCVPVAVIIIISILVIVAGPA